MPGTEGTFSVTDDKLLMRSVCDELAKAPARTKPTFEVKTNQGFSDKVWHSPTSNCIHIASFEK